MRRCLALLAVFGMLSNPAGAKADNPFDFSSSSVPEGSNSRRTAQVFSGSSSSPDETADDTQQQIPAQFRRSPASAATKRSLRNFENELFGDRTAPAPKKVVPPAADESDQNRPPSLRGLLEQPIDWSALERKPQDEPAPEEPVLELGFSNSSHRLIEPIPTSPVDVTADRAQKSNSAEPHETWPTASNEDASDHAAPPESHFDSSDQHPVTSASFEVDPPASDISVFQAEAADPPALSVSWNTLGPLNVGQDCDCELIVTNSGESTAHHVAIEASLPPAVHVAFSDPEPETDQGPLAWRVDTLAPGETQRIHLILVPHESGDIDASAHVRYTTSTKTSFTVSKPMLQIAVKGPERVNVGEPASQTVTVTNPGSGIAANVKLEAAIPEGLEHARGKRLLMDIGSLNPGETRTVRLALAAVSGGQHIVQVEARADSNLVKTASAEVHVVAPSLTATIDGPGLRYLGREATYTLRVRNVGNVASDNVRLMHKVPEGFEFIRADRGAQFDESSRILSWFVGRLEAAQFLELKVTLNPSQIGEFDHLVRAISEHGSRSDVQMTTRVEGVATLVMDISDLDDPVEVGRETAYEIQIKNEGSASAHEVGLVCELPEGTSFSKASGPTDHRAAGATVTFQPSHELPAGASLTYRVHVTGNRAGDIRFRCRLTSESTGEPLVSEELTKFYGD